MGTLRTELKLAARSLWRAPLFTLPVLATLAISIAASSAMFAALYTLVLQPLPFPEPERLAAIFSARPDRGALQVSLDDLRDWQSQAPSLLAAAGYRDRTFALDLGDGALPVINAGLVTPRFFEALGVNPLLGRGLSAEDGNPGGPRLAWLGYALWRSRFGGDPGVIGRTLRLNDEPRTIAGVLPAWFTFAVGGRATELYLPLEGYQGRATRALWALARLRPGATVEQANAELAAVAERLARAYPETNARWSAGAIDLHRSLVGDRARPLALLMGAVSLLFLIALFNVLNLVLARATSRLRESAIRVVLGASPAQELRRHLGEGALLGLCGGALGLWLGRELLPLLLSWERVVPSERARALLAEVRFGGPALLFGAALSLLTVLFCACAPLLLQRGLDPQRLLQQGAAALRTSGRSPRGPLVVAEVALSFVLLLFAGLFLRSLFALLAVEPGFNPDRVVVFGLGLPEVRYDTEQKQLDFHAALLSRLQSLPGIEVASGTFGLPLSGSKAGTSLQREGRPQPAAERPRAGLGFVAPRYFEAMGIPLLAGRVPTQQDGFSAPPVCVISSALARVQFAGEDPIGQRLILSFRGEHVAANAPWTVIGVVGDVHQADLQTAPAPQLYLPFTQAPVETMQYTLRTRLTAAALAGSIRAEVRALDPRLERVEPHPLAADLERTLAERRTALTLLCAFAALALLLTAVGLYGVISVLVAQRTRELGIRIALGARAGQVLSLVLGAGARLVLLGLAVGLCGGLAAGRVLQSQLAFVSSTDPLVQAAVAVLLFAVALLACLLPALRATRVDPMEVLRQE